MNSIHAATITGGEWRYLRSEIYRRTINPFQSVPFVVYTVLAIIMLGSAGIWYEILKIHISTQDPNYNGVVVAYTSFYLALTGSASHRLILSSTDKPDKVMVSFSILAGALSILFLVAIHLLYELDKINWLLTATFAIIPMWIWWIANGDDPVFQSIVTDAATGGNTNRTLQGSLEGYKDN